MRGAAAASSGPTGPLAAVAITLVSALAVLAGCAGYRAGALPDRPPAKVYLEPVQNEAYLSGMVPLFQRELRRAALQSRAVQLVDSPEDADQTAYVRLADFRERPVAFLPQDTGQAITSRLSLGAVLTITAADGRKLVEEEYLSAETAVYSDPETAFPNPVDQSKPHLARNLAATVLLAIELAPMPPQASD